MTKKKITISIDSEVLETAKKQMPNISEFLNECLKQYLGLADGIYPTAKASDIVKTISKSQAELFILNESVDVQERMESIEADKINRPLRKLWFDYRKRLEINPDLMADVLKVIDIDEETLEDILDYAYENNCELNIDWKEVYENYKKEEDE